MVPFSLTNKSVYKPQSPAAEGKGKLAVSLSPSRRIPGGSEGKEFTCNAGDPGLIPRSDPRVRKIPWRREWLPTPVFMPGESHGQRSLVG